MGNGVETESRKEETTESTKPPPMTLLLILNYHSTKLYILVTVHLS